MGGVRDILRPVAQVQHGPWDVSDGGAGDTAVGVACLDRWLVTQVPRACFLIIIMVAAGGYDDDSIASTLLFVIFSVVDFVV